MRYCLKKNRKSSGSLLQIGLSVIILVLLGLLVGNVVLILMAINLNNSVCKQAAQAGAEVYALGGDQKDLQTAVFFSVNRDENGGFFINHPVLTELRCYTELHQGQKRQMLSVKTRTTVCVPAPFLLFFAGPMDRGRLLLTSQYAVKLKNQSLTGFCNTVHPEEAIPLYDSHN